MSNHNRNITTGDRNKHCLHQSHYNPFIYYPNSGKMKINFGAHKGKFITQVPKDYLLWCEANVDHIRKESHHHLQIFLGLKKEKDKNKAPIVGDFMPYGKYKGQPTKQVMTDDPRYYRWFKKDIKSHLKKQNSKK